MGHTFGKAKADDSDRRAFLQVAVATSAAIGGSLGSRTPAAAFTRAQRDQMTAEQIITTMQRGNERFRTGKEKPHNYLAQQKARATGQYPAAVLLSCIDSRAPADAGRGDLFVCRVAGNIANDDILGSLEFACQLVGAKVVLVMGHTACGAIKGAIDKAELGHLTGLLAKIRPAVEATRYEGERSAKNDGFVDAVARKNVELTMADIRGRSPVLADLEAKGVLKIAGAMYDIKTAQVAFFT